MAKFKVGDKVRVIGGSGRNREVIELFWLNKTSGYEFIYRLTPVGSTSIARVMTTLWTETQLEAAPVEDAIQVGDIVEVQCVAQKKIGRVRSILSNGTRPITIQLQDTGVLASDREGVKLLYREPHS